MSLVWYPAKSAVLPAAAGRLPGEARKGNTQLCLGIQLDVKGMGAWNFCLTFPA